MDKSQSVTRWTRLALFGGAALVAFALLWAVLSSDRIVGDALETLERGQADGLSDAVRVYVRGLEGTPTQGDLEALIAELGPGGLESIAVVGRNGEILAAAGGRLSPGDVLPSVPPVGRGGVRREGGLLRLAMRIPSQRPRRGANVGPPRRRGTLMLEIDPNVATDLRAASRRTIILGGVSAGGLLLFAVLLIRWIGHRERLERKLEEGRRLASLGRMSAVLAHELRNPLASLKGNSQLLARMLPAGEPTAAKAERVVAEAVRLETLTNDLLEFARTGALAREWVDPFRLVRTVAETAGADRVTVDGERAPSRWSLDPGRMTQVLSNLVENSLRMSEGPVEISVADEGGRLVFAVRDHGPGIPGEERERLFEPFYTKGSQGTGLGLAVAKRIVELHRGTIVAENAEGGGARFVVSIAKAEAQAEE